MEYFTLYNSVKIPKVGFGTYKVIDQSAQGIVETALSVGYGCFRHCQKRHFPDHKSMA